MRTNPMVPTLAVAQFAIAPDIAANAEAIRRLALEAHTAGADLVLFPEGALSGYVKTEIRDWADLDWTTLAAEAAALAAWARTIGITLAVGSVHDAGRSRPTNSLHWWGEVTARYDKRYLSHTEITDWFAPGNDPLLMQLGPIAVGATICIELQFPELFMAYEALGADLVLHPSYGLGPVGATILAAHAATNCLFIGTAIPVQRAADGPSGILGPDGNWIARCGTGEDIAIARMDRADPRFEIALDKARPWRRKARQGDLYRQVP
jgi:predicted amidohydrolase